MSAPAIPSRTRKSTKPKRPAVKPAKADAQLRGTASENGSKALDDSNSLKQSRQEDKSYAEVVARPKKIVINGNQATAHSSHFAHSSDPQVDRSNESSVIHPGTSVTSPSTHSPFSRSTSPETTISSVKQRVNRFQRTDLEKRGRSPPSRTASELRDPGLNHSQKVQVISGELSRVPKPKIKDPEARQLFEEYCRRIDAAGHRLDHTVSVLQGVGPLPTGWEVLEKGWAAINPWNKDSTNSNYRNTTIELQDLRFWKDFPDYEEIYGFSQRTDYLKGQFHHQGLPMFAGDLQWYHRYFDTPSYEACPAEINTVERRCAFFDQLNALLRLATPGGGTDCSYVTIGSGKLAMFRRTALTSSDKNGKKDPDRAAFWTDGKHPRKSPVERDDIPPHATEVPCLIVGDYKMTGKFNHAMVDNVYSGRSRKREEVKKVLSQIHDYMDMHNNRYGYVITETELIMFRRRNKKETWGQLDFSPAIHFGGGKGKLNPLMVLWYFHVKYAVMGDQYHLRSFIHNYDWTLNCKAPESPSDAVPISDSAREISSAYC